MSLFTVRLGSRKVLSGTWYTTTAKTTIKDLTGYTARAQVRKDFGSDEVMLDLSTTGGGIVITGGQVEDNIQLIFDDSDLDLIPAGEYVIDLMVLDNSGEPTHPIVDSIEFTPSFTPTTVV